jgi:putative flippase GtrA
MKKIKRRTRKELTRIGEYLVSGGVWFWSGYLVLIYLDDIVGLFWANFAGNAVGITLNFLLERFWVFRTKRPATVMVAAWRYIIYTAFNAFLLNYLILQGLRNEGIEPEIGQFIAAGFFTFWNYIWYRAWVFRGRERPKAIRHHA